MSVLAHFVLDGKSSAEPAVTRALAYILNSLPSVTDTFVYPLCRGHIREFGLGPLRVDRRGLDQGGYPDLTLRDENHRARIFLENKFWAGLTENQPVGYLENLPTDQLAALFFIVPQRRITAIWGELTRRCQDADIALVNMCDENGVMSARIAPAAQHTLLVTSWTRVLEVLMDAVPVAEAPDLASDIVQLRGLTTQILRRYMVTKAACVWWYGPFQTVEALAAYSDNGYPAHLYMAFSGHSVRHVGWTDDPAVCFDPAQAHCDHAFLQLAGVDHTYYWGEISPTPAGGAGYPNAVAGAADAFNRFLFNGPAPDDYVCLSSSFYASEIDDALGDYRVQDSPTGFPVVIVFNPYPDPPGQSNWIVVRAPTCYATTGDVLELRSEIAALRAAVMGGAEGC